MIPFQICFRNMRPSDSVAIIIQERIERLEQFFDNVISCDVVVSLPHRHKVRGRIPHIQARLHVPGNILVVDREPEKDESHRNIFVVIADVFDALERQLEDYVRVMREHHPRSAQQL